MWHGTKTATLYGAMFWALPHWNVWFSIRRIWGPLPSPAAWSTHSLLSMSASRAWATNLCQNNICTPISSILWALMTDWWPHLLSLFPPEEGLMPGSYLCGPLDEAGPWVENPKPTGSKRKLQFFGMWTLHNWNNWNICLIYLHNNNIQQSLLSSVYFTYIVWPMSDVWMC